MKIAPQIFLESLHGKFSFVFPPPAPLLLLGINESDFVLEGQRRHIFVSFSFLRKGEVFFKNLVAVTRALIHSITDQ